MRIDVHAHYNPKALLDAAQARGASIGPLPPHPDGLGARIELMNESGVDLTVLWPNFQPYFSDEQAAVSFARLTNDTYRDEIASHPGRLSAWGCVPLPHVEAAIEEAARCLDSLGFVGIGFGCSVLGQPLDSDEFAPLWAELDRRAATVFLHPGQAGGALVGAESFGLGPCIVSPAEIGLAGARLVLSGLTRRFPRVNIVLAAGGGTLPYAWGKIDHILKFRPSIAPFKGNLKEELARFHYDTSFPSERIKYSALCELCGSSHIVFGTDQPFGSIKSVIEDLERAPSLSAEDRHAILDVNAARLLFGRA